LIVESTAVSDLIDLYPGFASEFIETDMGPIFTRRAGAGAPLLLLHGYPQTNVMWHRVAPALARHFSLVIPDLPGYGWSAAPRPGPEHAPYNKRATGAVMRELMAKLGFSHFQIAGHDRGGRVAYRLALDHPDQLTKIAVLDILPTHAMWHAMDQNLAMRTWHWMFLAQPYPLPEMLIGKAPTAYLEWIMASWTKSKDLAPFDERALSHYRAFFQAPERIHATCEDYRAGRGHDLMADEADYSHGRKITCPLLALWGTGGIPTNTAAPLEIWRNWAPKAVGRAIDSGHFLAEENAQATAAALTEFFL
jgi:haloacetate dehalogenase